MVLDTIYALSSGTLPSAVAIVRLSGPGAGTAVERLIGFIPEPRRLELATIRGHDGLEIDRGFVAFFRGPSSFTGEDVAELQIHGSKAVVAALFRELAEIPSLRAAEAGEFARRAHANGKFDLTAAEALADLIDAETEAQRRFALRNASGRNALLYQRWRHRLIEARAMVEAELDFSDEEDVTAASGDTLWAGVATLRQEIKNHIRGYRHAEIVRDGFQVALIGAPNAGKSSLLNALAKRDAAIVSDEPGTTRDLVVVNLDLGGVKVVLTDTAGIREDAGPVERQGIERAKRAARTSDLVLLLHDLTKPVGSIGADFCENVVRIGTKSDLIPEGNLAWRDTGRCDLAVSAMTGDGLVELLDLINERAARILGSVEDVVPFRERHVSQLLDASRILAQAIDGDMIDLEIRAELLRGASLALGRIIGDVDVENILDVIFSRFCIGK